MKSSSNASSVRYSAAAVAAAVVTAAAAALFAASVVRSRRRREEDRYEARIAKLEETRRAERTGRIRAEMKLRTHMKERDAGAMESSASSERGQLNDGGGGGKRSNNGLLLHCIGTVISPYTKRMGTPRQGALVPSGRGFVQLKIPVECVEGLELYSHAWIVFTFHANTDALNNAKVKTNGSMMNLTKTKIKPPRGNGIKVGMLATRSPHRPNNIGLSLVRVVGVDKKMKRLHIAALDLVNGTPVYDVKPCVPWDVPGHHDEVPLSVPNWVSQDDELKSVMFSPKAERSLEECVRDGKLAPLYTRENDGVEGAANAIQEILAQDPRASNSNGPNRRGSSLSSSYVHNNDVYKMLFCSTEVEFRVGTDGVVMVENVRGDFDLENVECVDGIPIILDGAR
eukprot:CAMPEP_0172553596 /NCGR_PEP_ID=MMETSP1067-20121228/51297_1 /TAXON_ID=265564 ORGANISM="Thalassiosira punctigera, Strain Tpunct2005C2" /NCGR_SAMPLE_ID=MMETSP1067 /ASSEMBLY_ACC=CAM_ASM_000444 /LENGTH=397 /DNA_ID=CAMNT_0013341809 /DNA_START=272 /DNA_END=1465 /DNA_ORIENTATION=-